VVLCTEEEATCLIHGPVDGGIRTSIKVEAAMDRTMAVDIRAISGRIQLAIQELRQ